MSDEQISETIEAPEDFEVPEVPTPTMRTLLEVWREVLNNVDTERGGRVVPALAMRILAAWPGVTIQEAGTYLQLYYERLGQYRDALVELIGANPDALKNTDDDAIDNKAVYLQLLLEWQWIAFSWEQTWDSDDVLAHVDLAAHVDATNFVLGDKGLVAHFGKIGFQYTEDDAAEIQKQLLARQEEA